MTNKSLLYIIMIACVAMCFTDCRNKEKEPEMVVEKAPSIVITNDSMVYGLTCDGSGDSTFILYPMEGGDLITYSCIDAKLAKRIIGKPTVGDWVGVVVSKEDSTEAYMIINLDQLKGTWTYPVMPQMKDYMHLSKRMQRRMEREALENMPDSMKELYMVPREYGFSLKRSHVAQSVGRVYSGSSLEDDSPVEYPPVKNYKQWYPWNGRLILISGPSATEANEDGKIAPDVADTLDFVSLDDDSLILSLHGMRYGFHRKQNAINANAEAQKKAQKAAELKTAELK